MTYRRHRRRPSQLRCLEGVYVSAIALAFLFLLSQLKGIVCMPLVVRGAECTFVLPGWLAAMPWIIFAGGILYTCTRGYLDFFTDAYVRDVIEADSRW